MHSESISTVVVPLTSSCMILYNLMQTPLVLKRYAQTTIFEHCDSKCAHTHNSRIHSVWAHFLAHFPLTVCGYYFNFPANACTAVDGSRLHGLGTGAPCLLPPSPLPAGLPGAGRHRQDGRRGPPKHGPGGSRHDERCLREGGILQGSCRGASRSCAD